MATVAEAVGVAFEHHAAGRLAAAEEIYRRVLDVDAGNRAARRLLGRLLLDTGRPVEASASLESVADADAGVWVDIARARHATRDLERAEGAARRAAALDPTSTEAWTMAGVMARVRSLGPEGPTLLARALVVQPRREETLGRFLLLAREWGGSRADANDEREALRWFRRGIEVAPEDPVGHFRLACVLVRFNHTAEAEVFFRLAAALAPDDAEIWSRFGATAGGRNVPTVAEARRAILLRPDDAPARLHVADAALAGKRRDLARAALRVHLSLDPASLPGWLAARFAFDEDTAEVNLGRVLKLDPDYPNALAHMAAVADRAGRADEARALLERAITRDPLCAEAHWQRSFLLLRGGDWLRGWEDYEWRFLAAVGPTLRRTFSAPPWDGRRLSKGPLLLHAEQGFGDALQMLRLVETARDAAGVPVVVEMQSPLFELTRDGLGVRNVTIVERGPGFPSTSGLPDAAAAASLMSLPRLLRLSSPDVIPGRDKWLSSPESRRAFWANRLGPGSGRPRIGLVWGGNPDFPDDATRSLSSDDLSRLLARIGDEEIVRLQFGPARSRLPPNAPPMIDPTGEVRDFADTAAILERLDLMITTCTSTAHLSGALGVPTWVLLSANPDFRWGVDREDSPWYPSLRLFRRPSAGDWDSVFARVEGELKHVSNVRRFS